MEISKKIINLIKTKSIHLNYILLGSFSLILFFPTSAHASTLSLGIYPPLIKIKTSPGSHIQKQITISNYGDSPITLNIVLKMFTGSDKANGQIVFLPQTTQVKDFFSEEIKILDGDIPVNQLLLAPQQKKALSLDIRLPKEITDEDHYFSILFITNNSQKVKSNASFISDGIAANVLLSVLSQQQQDIGYIKTFQAPATVNKPFVPFTLEVGNQTNNYTTATGTITIKNIFLLSKYIINLEPTTILAHSSRFMTEVDNPTQIIWQPAFVFGLYSAEADIHFEHSPITFHKKIYFYSYPLFSFITGSVVIIFIGIISFRIYTKRG